MALVTICGECRREFSLNTFSTFKEGKCLKCQKADEEKNRAADDLVRGMRKEQSHG